MEDAGVASFVKLDYGRNCRSFHSACVRGNVAYRIGRNSSPVRDDDPIIVAPKAPFAEDSGRYQFPSTLIANPSDDTAVPELLEEPSDRDTGRPRVLGLGSVENGENPSLLNVVLGKRRSFEFEFGGQARFT